MRYPWIFGVGLIVVSAGAAGAAVYRHGISAANWIRPVTDKHNSSRLSPHSGHDHSDELITTPTSLEQAGIPVKVAKLIPAAADSPARSLTGVVKARYETSHAFRINGKILRRHVEIGDRVSAGQLLFELEPEDYQLQVKAAEAALNVAEANVIQTTADEKRQRLLVQTNAISDSEYERTLSARDIALGQKENARRQLDLARNQLNYCRLTAEATGLVTAISAEAGQVVTVGAVVCQIAQDDQLEAVVDIPENRLPQVLLANERLTATATFWSLPGLTCTARLRELSPVADPLTRTYRCRLTLQAPPTQVKLGMTTTVELLTSETVAAKDSVQFIVPASALFQKHNRPAVWVVCEEQGKISPVTVELVKLGTDQLVIKGPLAAGQQVVSAGAHMLDESSRVQVWERSR